MNTVLPIAHIVSDAEKKRGKPHIAGTGITVQYIAELYNLDYSVQDIAEGFDLTPGQVHAALSYYFDHKSEIDASIKQEREATKAQLHELEHKRLAISADEFRRRIEARQRQAGEGS